MDYLTKHSSLTFSLNLLILERNSHVGFLQAFIGKLQNPQFLSRKIFLLLKMSKLACITKQGIFTKYSEKQQFAYSRSNQAIFLR